MLEIKRLNLQLMAEGDGDGGQAAPGTEAQQEAQAQPENLEAEFDALVKGDGKFREIYGKRQQKAVLDRTKGMKASVDRLNAWQPAMEVLAARYGMQADDPALIQKIAGDSALLEDLALKNGSSTDAEMQLAKARAAEERANALYRNMMAQQDMQRWQAQAQELQAEFPDFDLSTELENPEFQKLLRSGVDMQGAYMALHHRDIRQVITKRAEKKVADQVAAGKSRPRENGAGSQSGGAMTVDPMRLSKKEFNDYMKRVERGEKISFSK